MAFGEEGGKRRSPAGLVGGVTAVAVLATVAVVALPFLRFAYRAPAVHVMLETANALIALVVAYLVYGRFAQNRRLQELLLVLAMCSVAIANLALTALPSAVALGADAGRWAALGIRLIGTLLLAGAAFIRPAVRLARRRGWVVTTTIAAAVVAVSVAGLLYGDVLPPTVDPALSLGDASAPRLVAHPVVLAVHSVGVVLYGGAAAAFTIQSARRGDELLRWVAAACVLGAFARVHYLLFPSLYSDYVYTGDLLRSGFYLLILVGAAREIRSYWELRTHTAVLEDRRRLARDLHDGLTQELTYICAQTQRLSAHPEDQQIVERIGSAAGRALDEARRAVAALTRQVDEPFAHMFQRLTEELSQRYDVRIETLLDHDADVSADRVEAILRITGEAIRNAARHGEARRIEVAVSAEPLRLTITDDGRGFVVDGADRARGFGLTSMRERARAVGAEFALTSSPGLGATVRVTWP